MWVVLLTAGLGVLIVLLVVSMQKPAAAPLILPSPTPGIAPIVLPSPPSLPTEISMPEIKFPEMPDFEKIAAMILEKLPSTEQIQEDWIEPWIEKIPTVEEIGETIKEITPKPIRDPLGYVGEKIVEGASYVGGQIVEGATSLGEKIMESRPYTGKTTIAKIPPYLVQPSYGPMGGIAAEAGYGLGEQIVEGATWLSGQIVEGANSIFKSIQDLFKG